MAKYKQTKKKYDNKKKTKQPAKLTARQEKQAVRAVKKKETKKRVKEREEQKQQAKLRKLKESQQQQYKIDLKRLTSLLVTRVQKSGQNIMKIVDDPLALKTNLQAIKKKYPELAETADKFLEQRELELGDGIYRDEAMINQLEREFRANHNRLSNRNNVRYDSGILDITAYMIAEAVYRVFKDEAAEKGISARMFKEALNEIVTETPYLLYEGVLNSKGNLSRDTEFKSPRDLADMAIAIALNDGHVDEREVKANAW